MYIFREVNATLGDKSGFVSLTSLFWIVLLAALSYGAYKFAPPYFGYYMLKYDVEEEARYAHMYDDQKLAERITRKAATWSVPLKEDSLFIERGAEDIVITVHYTVGLDFFDRYGHTIAYDIAVREPLKDKEKSLR